MSTRKKAFAYDPKQYLADVVWRVQEPTFHMWLNRTIYLTQAVRAVLNATPKNPPGIHCVNFRDLMTALWVELFTLSVARNSFSMIVRLRQKGKAEPQKVRFTVLLGHSYGNEDQERTITLMLADEYLVW